MKFQITALICLLFLLNLSAEDFPKIKFGKVTKEELNLKTCPLDSNAHAMYLINDGYTEFNYQNHAGFVMEYTRYFKLKVFSKEGDDYATVRIPYYVPENSTREERVSRIKACTYNLVNGKIEKVKLDSKDIYRENVYGNRWEKKFSLPNVQPGSVIEVEYQISSGLLWNLPSWRFQYDIPVKWSRYETSIPEFFEYGREMKGYLRLEHHENTQSAGQIGDFDYTEYGEIMIAKDVPAFKVEPYVDASTNYISEIKFELRAERPPQTIPIYHTSSWEKIAKDLYDSDGFGGSLRNASYWDKDWSKQEGAKDTLEFVNDVFKTLQEKVSWNNEVSIYSSKSLSRVLKEGSGNSADINLMLVAILHKEGIEAAPVCLRLRSSGRLPFSRPSLSSLNYVVASVKLGGKLYLLDATEDFLPFGVLPERCINGKGIRFEYDKSVTEINLSASEGYSVNKLCSLSLLADGSVTGSLDYKKEGYAGIDAREKYAVEAPDEKMQKSFESKFAGSKVDSCSIVNQYDLNEALVEKYAATFSSVAQVAGDLLFMNPVIVDRLSENPFKLENREYPVDFTYPRKESYILMLNIPEGYKIEEIPTSVRIGLPDNGGIYSFMVQDLGGKLQVVQQFSINKSLFLPSEYAALKEFYDHMVAKQNEQIVLKKI